MVPVAADTKVSAVKALVAAQLAKLDGGGGGAAIDPQRVRLRDKKVSSVGSILRDSASLRRSLMNLVDGRQVPCL